MLRKLFFRKPPDGLLEICERVYGTLSLSFSNSFNCTFPLNEKKPAKNDFVMLLRNSRFKEN